MAIVTDTGKEYEDPEDVLNHIRECIETMFDPNKSLVTSHLATTDMAYAFKALDRHLSRGGDLPFGWQYATGRGKPSDPRV